MDALLFSMLLGTHTLQIVPTTLFQNGWVKDKCCCFIIFFYSDSIRKRRRDGGKHCNLLTREMGGEGCAKSGGRWMVLFSIPHAFLISWSARSEMFEIQRFFCFVSFIFDTPRFFEISSSPLCFFILRALMRIFAGFILEAFFEIVRDIDIGITNATIIVREAADKRREAKKQRQACASRAILPQYE